MASIEHFSRNELLAHLALWNAELTRNHAELLVSEDAAQDLTLSALRAAVIGTAARLGEVAQATGEAGPAGRRPR